MKKKRVIIVLSILVILVLACCIFYFFNKDQKDIYITAKPINGDLSVTVIASGEVMAQDLVTVGAEVSGQIEKLYVSLGDSVKKGDLIAKIDSEKQQNELDKVLMQLKIYRANLEQKKIAFEIAKKRFEREEKLYKAKATSLQSLEDSKNALSLSMANLTEIEARIEQANIDLDIAKKNLSYTNIVSPLDGVIVSLPVKEGQTLNAMQIAPKIAEVADLSKMEINLEISEADIPKIALGMEVVYKILAFNDESKKSSISSIDPALSTLSNGVYSSQNRGSNSAVYYYAKAKVDNSDGLLKIGMTTENSIIINQSKNTLYIPTSAIFKEGNSTFVKVLKNGKATKKEVKVGIANSINSEILQGLSSDDEVIITSSSPSKLIISDI
ncbi:efflux RND transporter periplasmic adaptor subunit [uncultured Campylobacter sp.]|uniref:efflux RND transporter periplasmic adaptor subunit n=1 Tax=uncultured Campylobacter sp. TaxID=218934 RepID=UPI00262619CD|nr:efflux RND transporter periplasmic adaptor subunit [uncultured Campylobacter sp.]